MGSPALDNDPIALAIRLAEAQSPGAVARFIEKYSADLTAHYGPDSGTWGIRYYDALYLFQWLFDGTFPNDGPDWQKFDLLRNP